MAVLESFVGEDGVAEIWFNRPETLNALNTEVLEELSEVFVRWEDDPRVRVVVMAGRGERAFVAGADIREVSTLASSPDRAKAFCRRGQTIFNQIALGRLVTIAAISGFALGGGLELALAADFRFADESAQLGLPEINLGILPGFGGTQRLGAHIGESAARWMIMTGDTVGAEEALRLGLVDLVVERGKLDEAVRSRAGRLAAKAPRALARVKMLTAVPVDTRGFSLEADAFADLICSQDGQEGVAAFLQKRKPVFRGD